MQIDLSRFRDTFFEEAGEHAAHLERDLLRLESAPTDTDLLNAIFRAAHSIKGAAGYFGLADLTAFTHSLENLLQSLRTGEKKVTPQLIELLLGATDVLKELLETSRNENPAPETVRPMLDRLAGAGPEETGRQPQPSATEPSAGRRVWRMEVTPDEALLAAGMDPLLLLRDLGSLGDVRQVDADLSRLPDLSELDPESCYLAWTVVLETDASEQAIREVFSFVDGLCKLELTCEGAAAQPDSTVAVDEAPEPSRSGKAPASAGAPARAGTPRRTGAMPMEAASIRVPTERVDELINMVGELVIAQSMVDQVVDELPDDRGERIRTAIAQLARGTRDLQRTIMSVRMLPVAMVFDRFPRVVRDLAAACGKQVQLRMEGEDTELDKSVIEHIADPLLHLVRNAVDHGIETPDERRAAGKPEQGALTLSATHESGAVIIEIQDDGRGLDADRIRTKALEMGLIDGGEELTEERLHALILQPGFSTAQQISDVSGRGVGMDVVSRNIEAINGSISISSRPGQGTRLRIRLPLTLAILDVLTVAVGRHTYLVPLLSVVESVRPEVHEVRTVAGSGEVLMVRGEPVPLIRLHRVLGIPGAQVDPCRGLVVLVEHDGHQVGLLVDALVGQRQAVIKSLEMNYTRVDGLMGATILGDGTVAFILDVNGIARLALTANATRRQHAVKANLAHAGAPAPAAETSDACD